MTATTKFSTDSTATTTDISIDAGSCRSGYYVRSGDKLLCLDEPIIF